MCTTIRATVRRRQPRPAAGWPFLCGLVLLTVCTCGTIRGQPADGGARAVALAGAATALADDAWGEANPAAWAAVPRRFAAVFASEGFGLRELRSGAARYVEVLPFGTLAAGARTFGFEAYRETRFELGFARSLRLGSARRFLAGVRVHHERVVVEGYGHAAAVGISAGGLVSVLPDLHFGFAATNLNAPRWGDAGPLPRSLALGLAYRPDERLLLVLDAHKESRFPLSVRAGLEAALVAAFALRAGVATAPTRFSAGAGVRLGRLAADVAAMRHEVLGWTPALSLALLW